MNLITFTKLAGVPVHYDRNSKQSYGTRGIPFKPRALEITVRKLNDCFEELFDVNPFKKGEVIISAGAYFDKPGQHGNGKAFDLDGIFWEREKLIAIEYPEKPILYISVESILRKYFGTILSYNYNLAHRDHFHLDTGSRVGFNQMSKSRVEYLQGAITWIYGYPILIDGIWGPQTKGALEKTLQELDISNIEDTNNWVKFLDITAKKGFASI